MVKQKKGDVLETNQHWAIKVSQRRRCPSMSRKLLLYLKSIDILTNMVYQK